MSADNVIGDVDGLKRDNRERAAMLFFEAKCQLVKLVTRQGPITAADLGNVGVLVSDGLTLLETGGVATPRLPTAKEMDR